MLVSSTQASGSNPPAALRAALPSKQVSTSYPAASRSRPRVVAASSLSSTTRTRGLSAVAFIVTLERKLADDGASGVPGGREPGEERKSTGGQGPPPRVCRER